MGCRLSFAQLSTPPASIEKKKQTIDIESEENAELEVYGRHDLCIVPRVLPVLEAVTAIGLIDLMLGRDNE